MASVNGENEEMAHIGKVKAGGTGQKKLDINMGHNKPVRNECLSIVHGIVENGIDTACSSGENIHVNGRNDVSDQTIFNESATLKSTTENHESTVKTLLHGLVDTIVKIHSSQFVVKSFDMPKESVSHHSNGKLLDVKLCTSQNVKEKGNNVKNTFASSKEQVNMIDNGEAYVLPVKKENPLQGKVLDSLSADALALLDECQKSEKILLTLDKSVKSIDTHDEIISISTNKSYKMEDDKSFSQNNNKTFEENLLSTGTKSRPFVSTSEDISTTKSLDPLRSSRRKRIPKKKIDEEKPEVPITPIIKEKLPIVETEIIYILGDLVWAYVPGHPLWPCMIVDDPLEPVFTKMKGGGAKPGRAYHVQFLGDSPEHGWVRETRVFSYTGPEDYERIIKEIALKHKRLNIKVPRLEIPARLKDDWDSGLEEIMEAVVCSVEERMINFAYDFKPYMKKLKNKIYIDEECSAVLGDVLSALCDAETHSTEVANLSIKNFDFSIAETSSLAKKDLSATKVLKVFPKQDRVSSKELTNTDVICEHKISCVLDNPDEKLQQKTLGSPQTFQRGLSERKLLRSSSYSHEKNTKHEIKSPQRCDFDFSAFPNLFLQKQVTSVSSAKGNVIESNKDGLLKSPERGDRVAESIVLPSSLSCDVESQSVSHAEKLRFFKSCLGLVGEANSEKSARKPQKAANNSGKYKDCTCTALQQVRGLKGGVQYPLKTLLDAIYAVENGFSYDAVSSNFNIPKLSLIDFRKHSTFMIKHHSKCKLFTSKASTVIENLVKHVKSEDNCRRLRLATSSTGAIETCVSSHKKNPTVVINRQPLSAKSYAEREKSVEKVTASNIIKSVDVIGLKSLGIATRCSTSKYSLYNLVCALDDILSQPPGVSKNIAAVARLHGVPCSTLYDSVKRNGISYKKFVKSGMTREERLLTIKKNYKAFGITHFSKSSAPEKDAHQTLNEQDVKSVSLESPLSTALSKKLEDLQSQFQHSSKLFSQPSLGLQKPKNILTPGRTHNYTMKSLALAIKEAHSSQKLKPVADKYGIPCSTLRDKVHGYHVKKKRKLQAKFQGEKVKRSTRISAILDKGRKNKYTAADLVKAISEVKKMGKVGPVALKYGIPSSTLRDNAFGRERKGGTNCQKHTLQSTFKDRENLIATAIKTQFSWENLIATAIKTQLSWGWNLTYTQIRLCISNYIEEGAIEFHKVNNVWVHDFLSRHNILPHAMTDVDERPDPFKIFAFFDMLESYLHSFEGYAESVLLLHEFDLLSQKNNSVRILAALSALGDKRPPLLVFKGNSLWCSSANNYPGSQFAISSSGEMTIPLWKEWFRQLALSGQGEPLLLLYDGNMSFLPIDIVNELLKINLCVLKLPYSSNVPFELPYAVPVKQAMTWYEENRASFGNSSTQMDVLESVGAMWKNVFSTETILRVFQNSGFYPCNREAYPVESMSKERLAEYRRRNPVEGSVEDNEESQSRLRTRIQKLQSLAKKDIKRVVYSAGVTANAEDEEKPSSKEKPEDFNSSIKQSNPKQKSSAVTKKAIKIKMKSPAGINSKSSRSGRMKKQEAITSLMLGKETSPNQELFKFYCEKRLGPLKTEHPTLTPEQVEALIWMEWESLSPEKQEKYGAKRSLSSPEVLKRKRGRPFKRPPVKNQDVAMNSAMLPETKAVEVKNLFRCTLCNDSYATKHSLAQHKRWCSGPPSAAKATFSEKSSLSSNPIENTSLEKTFTCHDCQDKFYGEKSLQIHKKFCSASKSSSPLTAVLSPRRKVVGDRSKRRSAKTFDDAPSDKSSSLPVRTSTPTNSSQPSPTAVANKNLLCHDNSAPCSNNNAIMGYSINDGSLITKKSKPRGPTQLGSSSRKENICVICEEAKPGLISCVGGCCQSFHAACFGDEENTKEIVDGLFKCKNCINHTHCCFICKKGAGTSSADLGDIKRCNVPHCGKHYHSLCLHSRKLSILAAAEDSGHNMAESFRYSLLNNSRCTFHHCATCASKATDDLSSTGAGCRMFKCLRCPTAYHAGIDCLAAGSTILPGLNIICPEHFEPLKNTPYHQPVHVSWCFVCSKGWCDGQRGQLICCENCPAAFHPQCVDMDAPPEGEWYCRDCRYRRRPLYGDIVWVKLGSYRWWPGEITHPNDVPENIQNLRHGVGEFVVNFFGSNDYFWLNKRRVFAYQEGDTGASTAHCSRGISSVFNKALRDASKKFDELTSRRQKIQDVKTQKKRPQYKYIKVNRPVGNVQVYTCDLSEIPRCICKRTDSNPCGPDSECLNRMLMFECHPTLCPAGDKCENRRFQKRDYPSSEVFKTSWGGWGLKTKVSIKKGDFVNEYVGELVDNEECLRRIEYAHKNNITNFYMLTIDKDRIIDAGPKGNLSRFMNHCCDPSCETQKWTVNGDTRVGLFARRDIPEGTELTFNYNLDCLGNDKTPCMCGAKNCSGFIGVRPKPSTENGKSIETKVKKKRKRAEQRDLPKHDDFCFRCRQVGTLVCCDVRGCQRAFCLACLRLTKPPFGKWECPWHHCDFCGRRAQSFCHFCPNSFCASHVANQLLPSAPNKYDCCTDHDPNVAEYEMEEAIAAVVASMQPQENYEPGLDVKEPEEVTPLTPQDVKEKETPKATSKKIAQKEIPKTAEKQTLKASRKQNTKTTLKQATKNSRKQNLKLNLKNNLKKRVTSARKPTSKISLKKDPKASLKRPLKIVRKPIPIKRGRTTEEKEDNPKSRVRSLKRKRVEQKKNSVMEVKTEPVVVKDEVVAAPPPDFMNDTVTETESDTELLGVPRSSPVRRKRAKRRYFSGKKKRRKSKGIASLSASPNKLLLTDSASNNGSQLNSCTDDDQEVDVTSVSTLAT